MSLTATISTTVLEQLSTHPIIIFGLGAEGKSSYQLLHSQLPDAKFFLLDEAPLAELKPAWQTWLGQNDKAQFVSTLEEIEAHLEKIGTQTKAQEFANWTLCKTPGIPLSHPLVKKLLSGGAHLTSNTQLFFDLGSELKQPKENPDSLKASRQNLSSELKIIGVTGTKGKSTTAALIHHILTTNQVNSYLGGNIGQPALELYQAWKKDQPATTNSTTDSNPKPTNQPTNITLELPITTNSNPKPTTQPTPTYFILELSSHQLAELTASPHLAVIQHIFSEHLDYYDNFEQYLAAKNQIVRRQTPQDQVIFNADSQTATQLAKLSPGKKIPFSLQDKELVALARHTPLLGKHNLYNTIPAILIGRQAGLSDQHISTALKTFQPLPHRLELVAEIKGVKYVDDSIATNPDSAIAALKTFANQPIILLAGGYERQQDFSQLAQEIKQAQIKAIALFPPTGQRLLKELEKIDINNELQAKIEEFSSMTKAVHHAQQYAQPGDVVLLSPSAASFGLFKDYKARGDEFKAVVLAQQNDYGG